MSVTIIGATGYQSHNPIRSIDINGETVTQVHVGPSAATGALYSSLAVTPSVNLVGLNHDPGRGGGRLIATFRDPNTKLPISATAVQTEYELMSSVETRSIFRKTSPQNFAGMSAQTKSETLAAASNQKYYVGSTLTDPSPSSFTGIQLLAYKLLQEGQETYAETVFIFREKKTVYSKSAVTASYTGLGAVVATASLPGYNSNPMLGTLPAYEWLYITVQGRQIGQTWELVREWWGAPTWSGSLYSGGSGSP